MKTLLIRNIRVQIYATFALIFVPLISMAQSDGGMGEKMGGKMSGMCGFMCAAEMVLLGLLIIAGIVALTALSIFLFRRSRLPA